MSSAGQWSGTNLNCGNFHERSVQNTVPKSSALHDGLNNRIPRLIDLYRARYFRIIRVSTISASNYSRVPELTLKSPLDSQNRRPCFKTILQGPLVPKVGRFPRWDLHVRICWGPPRSDSQAWPARGGFGGSSARRRHPGPAAAHA